MKEESKTMDVADIIQASQKLITDFFRWLVFRGRTIFDNDIVSSEDVLLLGKAKLLSIPNPHGSPDKKGFHLIEKWRGLERWDWFICSIVLYSGVILLSWTTKWWGESGFVTKVALWSMDSTLAMPCKFLMDHKGGNANSSYWIKYQSLLEIGSKQACNNFTMILNPSQPALNLILHSA